MSTYTDSQIYIYIHIRNMKGLPLDGDVYNYIKVRFQ